jgi:hypothetical protein
LPLALGALLVLAGVIFGCCFPKKAGLIENFLAPDAVMSLGLTLGLIGSGFIVMFTRREKIMRSVLGVVLLWSLLANASLAALLLDQREGWGNMMEADAKQHEVYLNRLEKGESEDLTYVKESMEREIQAKAELSKALKK